MANKLYPPQIDGALPAFYLTYDASNTVVRGADITVPFTNSSAVADTEYNGFVLRLRTASSGSYLFSPIYSNSYDAGAKTVTFHLDAKQAAQLNEGQFYKVQIAYYSMSYDTYILSTNQILTVSYRTPGYFSTVGIIKCTSKPNVYINGLVQENVNFFAADFIGTYDQSECRDLTEKVYSYSFTIYNDKEEVYYTTGELLHQSVYDTEYNFSIDKVTVNDIETESGKNYSIQYKVTTLNGLELSTPQYKLTSENLASPNAVIEILPEANPDDGYITIHFKGSLDLNKSYYYVLNNDVINSERDDQGVLIRDAHNSTLKSVIADKISNETNKLTYIKSHNIYKEYNSNYNYPGFMYRWASNAPEGRIPKNIDGEIRYLVTVDYDAIISNSELTEEQRAEAILNLPYMVLLNTGRELVKNISYQYVKDNHINIKDYDVVEEAPYEAFYYGSYILSRSSDADNYTAWYNIGRFRLEEQVPSTYTIRDITVEHGRKYKYALQQTNIWGLISARIYSDIFECKFEDMYLFDGKKLLKIRYNPKVNTFKTTVLEQKTDTIGGKYPYITRNGETYYKEFPLGGLIAQELDADGYFISKTYGDSHRHSTGAIAEQEPENALRDWHMFSDENILLEREFKLRVLEWLNNGKPKLFKSPYEGNYIVRLMNNSLAPVEELGRMLHTFTSQAYEIAECNYNNLVAYGFIDIKPPSDYVGLQRSYLLTDPELINDDGDIQIDFDAGLETFTIQDMMPGDKIYIYFVDEPIPEEIMIGITGSYTYSASSDKVVNKIVLPSMSTIEQTQHRNVTGVVHCYYKGVRITAFDAIISQQLRTIPSKQWVGYSPWLDILRRTVWTGGNNAGAASRSLNEWEYKQLQNYNFRDYLDDIVVTNIQENGMATTVTYEINEKFMDYIGSFDPGEILEQINLTINKGEAYKIKLLNIEQAKFRLRDIIPVYVVEEIPVDSGNLYQAQWDVQKMFYNQKRSGEYTPFAEAQTLVSTSPYGYPYPIEQLTEFEMIDPFCIFQVFHQDNFTHEWVPVENNYGLSYYDAYYHTWLRAYEPNVKINYQWKKIVLIDDEARRNENAAKMVKLTVQVGQSEVPYDPNITYYRGRSEDTPSEYNGLEGYTTWNQVLENWRAYINNDPGVWYYPDESARQEYINTARDKALRDKANGFDYNEDAIYDYIIQKEVYMIENEGESNEQNVYKYYYMKDYYYSPVDQPYNENETYYIRTENGYAQVNISSFENNITYYIQKGTKVYLDDPFEIYLKKVDGFYISQGNVTGTPIVNTIYFVKDYDIDNNLTTSKEAYYKDLKDVNSIRIGTGVIAELTFQIKVIDYYTEIRNEATRIAKQYYLSLKKFYDNLMKNYAIISEADYNMQRYSALRNAYDKLLEGTNNNYLQDNDKDTINILLNNYYEKERLKLLSLYRYEEINDKLSIEEIEKLIEYKNDNSSEFKFGFDGLVLLQKYDETIRQQINTLNAQLTPLLQAENPEQYAEIQVQVTELSYELNKYASIAQMQAWINNLQTIINSNSTSTLRKAEAIQKLTWLQNELNKIEHGARLFYQEVDEQYIYYVTNNIHIQCPTYNFDGITWEDQIPDTIYRMELSNGDVIYYKVNKKYLQKKFQAKFPSSNIVMNDYMINYLPVYNDTALNENNSLDNSIFVKKDTFISQNIQVSIMSEGTDSVTITGLALFDADELATYQDTERYIYTELIPLTNENSEQISFYEDEMLALLADKDENHAIDGVAKKLEDISTEIESFNTDITSLYEAVEAEKNEYQQLYQNMQALINEYNSKVYMRWAYEELKVLAAAERAAVGHTDDLRNYYSTVGYYLNVVLQNLQQEEDLLSKRVMNLYGAVEMLSDIINEDLPKVKRYQKMVEDNTGDQLDEHLKKQTISKRGNIVVCLITMYYALKDMYTAIESKKTALIEQHNTTIEDIIDQQLEGADDYDMYRSLFCAGSDLYNKIYGDVVDIGAQTILNDYWAEDSGVLGYLIKIRDEYDSEYNRYYNLVNASADKKNYWDVEKFGLINNLFDDHHLLTDRDSLHRFNANIAPVSLSLVGIDGETYTIRNIITPNNNHKTSTYNLVNSISPMYNPSTDTLTGYTAPGAVIVNNILLPNRMTAKQIDDYRTDIAKVNAYIYRTDWPGRVDVIPEVHPWVYKTFAFFPLAYEETDTTTNTVHKVVQDSLSSRFEHNKDYYDSLNDNEKEQVIALSQTLVSNIIGIIASMETNNSWEEQFTDAEKGIYLRDKINQERLNILSGYTVDESGGTTLNAYALFNNKIIEAESSLENPPNPLVPVQFANNGNASRTFLYIPYEGSPKDVVSLYITNLEQLGKFVEEADEIVLNANSYYQQYLNWLGSQQIQELETLLEQALLLQKLYNEQFNNYTKKYSDYNSIYEEYAAIFGRYDGSEVMDFYKDQKAGKTTKTIQSYRDQVREAWWSFLITLDYNYSLEREKGMYAQ